MREQFKFSFTQTYIISLFLIGILGIYYVWILNLNATKGYNIRTHEVVLKNLTFEQNLLDIRIAEVQSLSSSNSSIITEGMQLIENPEYLVLKDLPLSFRQ